MDEAYFKIESLEASELFEKSLRDYYKKITNSDCYLPYFNLKDSYLNCKKNETDGRLFTIIFDIKLNLTFLDINYVEAIRTCFIRKNSSPELNILKNSEVFDRGINHLKITNEYVLRYRAIMDKIMGLMVFLYAKSEYDNFRKSQSRKKKFQKLFEKNKIPFFLNFVNVYSFLEDFDKKYRTPEVHSTGSLRKQILLPIEESFEYSYEIVNKSWHNLIYLISELDKSFHSR